MAKYSIFPYYLKASPSVADNAETLDFLLSPAVASNLIRIISFCISSL